MRKWIIALLILVTMSVTANAQSTGHTNSIQYSIDNNAAMFVEKVDQVSKIIDIYFINKEAETTLTAGITAGDRTFTVTSATSFDEGDLVDISENNHKFQALVTDVTGTTITVNIHVDRDFTTAAVVVVGSRNMAVDGSGTPVEYRLGPEAGESWDITQFNVVMNDDDTMDGGTYCGVRGGLDNGIYLVATISGVDTLIGFARTNSEYEVRSCTVSYKGSVLGPSGLDSVGVKCRFNGDENTGAVVRLNGDNGDHVSIFIQDDIDAASGCQLMYATAVGHVVD